MKLTPVNAYLPRVKTDKPGRNNTHFGNFIDKFETNIKNSADLNDTVQVPRTIFKGYLAFTAGTALSTIAAISRKKTPHIANFLGISSAALVIYGTYSFVRPYILKQNNK